VAAAPVVAGGEDAGSLVPRSHFVVGATAGEQPTKIPQGVDGLVVALDPQRLAVGAFVGVHAQPVEGRQDSVNPLLAVALGVGVLDPEHEGAPGPAGHQPVE
jgi:hypothetical protein